MTERTQKWQGMNWIRQSSRLAIYLRDGLSCQYCSQSVEDGVQLTLDHITPHSHGGCNHPTNLVTSCKSCNSSRGNRALEDFTSAERIAEIKSCTKRSLKDYRRQAKELIELRGSAAKALATLS